MKKNLVLAAFAFAFAHGAFAITATKAYVDGATNATLTAAKAYTDAHGGSSGAGANVLHYSRLTSSFEESAQTIAMFATTNQPLFAHVDGYLWFKLDNVVRQSVSGVQTYNLTLTCSDASNSATGIYKPWLMSILCAPSANYVIAQIAQANMLAENFTMLTNSAAFKAAVEALVPSVQEQTVTNLYGFSRVNLIDGDRKVYVKLPFSAWTNDVAGGGGSIPSGLRFTPTTNYDTRDYIFAWEAKNGSDTYTLQKMSQPGGVFYYDLKKNMEAPFPQAAVLASESATVLDFRTFKLYRFGSGDILVNTDTLALGSFASNVQTQVSTLDTKVNNRTARGYLASTIGWGNNTQAGLLGLYSAANDEPLWPFSMAYWGSVVYPDVKTWVGNNYVPKTRKINGQPLTTDITIQSMDYQAVTNTVNAVKAQFYDEPLQVNWTLKMVNGEMKLYATTNVNMSVL